jgi:hypothetical protein
MRLLGVTSTEFSKIRRAKARTDEELVRFHVGRRLNGHVPPDALEAAQDLAAERVQHLQMQVAIDEACAFAHELGATQVAA